VSKTVPPLVSPSPIYRSTGRPLSIKNKSRRSEHQLYSGQHYCTALISPFSSFIPGHVTVQLYSHHFQLYSQPCYCTALFLAMLLFSIIQVLFPTVLPYSFIPSHLFAVHGLFIAANNSHMFAVCMLFIAVKTIIICLLLFGSAQ
jgi:hypothetical protein